MKKIFLKLSLLLCYLNINAQLNLPTGFKPYLINGKSMGFNEDIDGDKLYDKFMFLEEISTKKVYICSFLSSKNYYFDKIYIDFNLYNIYFDRNTVVIEIGNGLRYLAKLKLKYSKSLKNMELIGFDDEKLPDNQQNFEYKSFNFLTKKYEINTNGKIKKGSFKIKKVSFNQINNNLIDKIQNI